MTVRSLALALLVAALWAVPAAAAPLGFDKPVYVDQHLAGGEPVLLTDTVHHDIIYSTHEGTTHIYRPGLASSTTFDFAGGYRNQVNVWTSRDEGRTWKVDDFGGRFTSNPAQNSGFSDPDLTQDAGGRVYNTGINLANDSLFSSNDGGVTWDRGTAQCHDGDRPWLAGAARTRCSWPPTSARASSPTRSSSRPTAATRARPRGHPRRGHAARRHDSYTGNGKLYYDRARRPPRRAGELHGRRRPARPVSASGPGSAATRRSRRTSRRRRASTRTGPRSRSTTRAACTSRTTTTPTRPARRAAATPARRSTPTRA